MVDSIESSDSRRQRLSLPDVSPHSTSLAIAMSAEGIVQMRGNHSLDLNPDARALAAADSTEETAGRRANCSLNVDLQSTSLAMADSVVGIAERQQQVSGNRSSDVILEALCSDMAGCVRENGNRHRHRHNKHVAMADSADEIGDRHRHRCEQYSMEAIPSSSSAASSRAMTNSINDDANRYRQRPVSSSLAAPSPAMEDSLEDTTNRPRQQSENHSLDANLPSSSSSLAAPVLAMADSVDEILDRRRQGREKISANVHPSSSSSSSSMVTPYPATAIYINNTDRALQRSGIPPNANSAAPSVAPMTNSADRDSFRRRHQQRETHSSYMNPVAAPSPAMADSVEESAASILQQRRNETRTSNTVQSPTPVAALPPLNPTPMSLIRSLIDITRSVTLAERSQVVCQKRNAAIIIRRIKVLSLLFEEVKETETVLPPSAMVCFRELHIAINKAKHFLELCQQGRSKILSVMHHEAKAMEFYHLTKDFATALDVLSLRLLDVSEEVKEQVELLHRQAANAEPYLDPKDEELKQSILSVLHEFENKAIPDPGKLRNIFCELDLLDICDCQKEIQLLEDKIDEQTSIANSVAKGIPIINLISFVRYCRCVLYGVTSVDQEQLSIRPVESSSISSTNPVFPLNESEESGDAQSLNIPDDFVCPISLDLMRDPVIVATGQTYDRVSITRWIEEGHLTCPKSGSKLIHTTLTPNYALRSLISKWCEEHGVLFQTPKKKSKSASGDCTPLALEATKMTVAFLLDRLLSGNSDASSSMESVEVQRQVAYELRLLAKCGMDNRKCMGEMGVIPNLVPLLSSEDPKTQENSVTALLNLSIYDGNKDLIVLADALDSIIEVLVAGLNLEACENAAATLFSLSVRDDYKVLIGSRPRALVGLVALLRNGSSRGRKDAATALFNISVHHANKPKVVKAGAVPALVELLEVPASPADDALAVMALLAGSAEGLSAISKSGAVPIMINLLRVGSPKVKESSLAVLLPLCKYGGDTILKSIMNSPYILSSLLAIRCTGTPRAQRKSTTLLKMIQRQEDYYMSNLPTRTHQLSLHP